MDSDCNHPVLFYFRSSRSSTSSWGPPWRMRCSRSCLFRSRPVPVRGPGSRPLLPSATSTAMWVSAWSAPRKWPQPSVGLSSWLNCPSSQCDVATGVTRSASPILYLARWDGCEIACRILEVCTKLKVKNGRIPISSMVQYKTAVSPLLMYQIPQSFTKCGHQSVG